MVGPSPPGRTHPLANYKQPVLRSQLLLCCSEQSSSLAKGNVFLVGFLPFYLSSQQVLNLPPELPNLGKIDPQWALLWCVGAGPRAQQKHRFAPRCHLLCSKEAAFSSFSSSSSLEDMVPLEDSRWSLWLNSPAKTKPPSQ